MRTVDQHANTIGVEYLLPFVQFLVGSCSENA